MTTDIITTTAAQIAKIETPAEAAELAGLRALIAEQAETISQLRRDLVNKP